VAGEERDLDHTDVVAGSAGERKRVDARKWARRYSEAIQRRVQ
jgi:hypothetical protein